MGGSLFVRTEGRITAPEVAHVKLDLDELRAGLLDDDPQAVAYDAILALPTIELAMNVIGRDTEALAGVEEYLWGLMLRAGDADL